MSKKIAKNGYRYVYAVTKYYGAVVHADTEEEATKLISEYFVPENEEHNDKYYLSDMAVKRSDLTERTQQFIDEDPSLRDLDGNTLPEKEWVYEEDE